MGPLAGQKVIEVKGIGPGPYAGMLLADMGADVIVVERPMTHTGIAPPSESDIHGRGKRSIVLDLKQAAGIEVLLRLADTADMLLEGNRPGVAERLGFGPDTCLGRNPGLVYGRVTGWGQSGPLAGAAGHDLNYIALTGVLAAIGGKKGPALPLNLIGDYAGGSLFLVIGMLAALVESKSSGSGQVVDAAIVDGSASLMSLFHGLHALGRWCPRRRSNLLDGAAPFYNVYETADRKYIAIGPLEPKFFAMLLDALDIDTSETGDQFDVSQWPALSARLAGAFRGRTRSEWCERLEGSDVCFAPVLDYTEAPNHPHNRARETYVEIGGVEQPAPAPRFSRTKSARPQPPHAAGADTAVILAEAGFSEDEVDALATAGVAK